MTWHDFALITDGVITDAQFEKMLAVTPDMEEIPYRASINPASHTWYDGEIAVQRPDGFVSYGYCNALGDILTALIPTSKDQVGRHYLISSHYRLLGRASDHLAAKHKYSPRAELIVALPPHAWYGDLLLRWSPTGHPKDLGPEIVITGNTSLEYAQIYYGAGRLAIFCQEANVKWRLLRQMDINIPITKAANFEAWQSFVNHGAIPMYMHAMQVSDSRVLIFAQPSPTEAENHCYLMELNLSTALSALFSVVTAVKLSLTRWDNQGVDLILLIASFVVFAAGLVSVRAITLATFGNRVLLAFVAVSLAVGLLILLL